MRLGWYPIEGRAGRPGDEEIGQLCCRHNRRLIRALKHTSRWNSAKRGPHNSRAASRHRAVADKSSIYSALGPRGDLLHQRRRSSSIYEVARAATDATATATATATHSHLPTCKMMRKQYSDASLKTPERGNQAEVAEEGARLNLNQRPVGNRFQALCLCV